MSDDKKRDPEETIEIANESAAIRKPPTRQVRPKTEVDPMLRTGISIS